MAYDVGITVGIDGGKKFQDTLRAISKETKTYKTALKELATEYNSDATAEDKARQKRELLTQQMDAQRRKVELLSNRLTELRADETKNRDAINSTIADLNKARAELNRTEQELKLLGSEAYQAGQKLQAMGEKLEAAGDKMMSAGRTLSMTLTAPVVAMGAAAVKAEADFSSSMSKVAALSGAAGDDFDALTNKALEMGSKTVFSAKESADAMSYMALAGYSAKEMLEAIEPVMNLAAASGEDLATVSDIVTDDLTAFGLSAKDAGHFTDVLAQTAANSNTNVSMMGEAFKYAAPLAGALGYSVDDIAVSIGLMADNGIKASMAGTTLRSLFTRLTKPTKESAQAMADLNITLTGTNGQMLPLSDVIGQMRDSFAGLTEQEKASYAAMLGGQRAMSGLLAIVNSSEQDFNNLTAAIDNADGAAERMAGIMLNNTKGSLTLMKSSLEGAAIAAGKALAPMVTQAAKAIQNIAASFTKLSPRQQQFIVKTALAAAAIGPVLAMSGKLAKTVGSITKGVGKLLVKIAAASVGMTTDAMATQLDTTAKELNAIAALKAAAANGAFVASLMTNPLFWFAGAIVGISAAIVALVNHFDRLGDKTREEMDNIKANADDVKSNLEEFNRTLDDGAKEADGQAEAASALIDRLEELSQKSKRTAAEQREMEDIVAALNSTYPEMEISIDATTGALSKSISEMRRYVEEARKMARANAYTEQLQISYVELAKAEQNASKATRDRRKAEKELEDAEKELAEYEAAHADVLRDTSEAGREAAGEYVKLKGKVTDLRYEVTEWKNTETEAQTAVTAAQEAVDLATEAISRNAAATADSAEQHRLLAAAEHQGAQAAQESEPIWNSLTATQKAAAQEIADAVAGIEESCQTSIESQMNLFEEFNKGTEIAKDKLLENMQAQVDGVKQWEKNLTELARRGIDEGLLQQMAEMGPASLGYTEAFLQMNADELANANRLFSESLNIKGFENDEADALKTAIGTITAGGEAAIQELGQKLNSAMDQSGKYTVEGLVNSITAAQEAVNSAMQSTAEAAEEGYTSYMEQASPSRRMARDGLYTVQGLVQGINSGRLQVSSAARAVGQLAAQVGSTARGYVNDAYSAGRMLSEGLARGIRDNASNAINAAADMARRTLQSAKNTLGVSSPSKEFYKIGDYSVQGYINALADGARSVMAQSAATFSPAYAAAYYPSMVSGAGSVTNVGGMTVNVYGAAGQDVNALADAVSQRISREFIRRAAG